jgi:hypothetical protein
VARAQPDRRRDNEPGYRSENDLGDRDHDAHVPVLRTRADIFFGAFSTPPKPMKDIPRKRQKAKRKPKARDDNGRGCDLDDCRASR